MNDNPDNTPLLIQYLDGELSGIELETVQAQLAVNSALQQELDNLRVSRLALQIHGLNHKVSSLHQEMMQELREQPPAKPTVVRRLWPAWVRIAAFLVMVAGSWLLYEYLQSSSRSLFREQYQPFVLHENRGGTRLSTLDSLYQAQAYSQVLQIFPQLQAPTATDCFFAGNAALFLNQPAVAVACLQQATQYNQRHQGHFFEDDIDYYLATAYLQNEQPRQALYLFEKIHADGSHPYNKNVGNWFLQKLRWAARKK